MGGITRRDLVFGAAYGTIAVLIGLREGEGSEPKQSQESMVVIIRDEKALNEKKEADIEVLRQMLDQAIIKVSGEKKAENGWRILFNQKDFVGIKYTHCGWMRVHTHLELVEAVKGRLKDIGIGEDSIVAKDQGLPFEKCTALINMPSIKAHPLTGIAVSLKNYINFNRGKESTYHHGGSANLGEIWKMPGVQGKTRMVIVDALTPYFGPGPQIDPRYYWDFRGIVVGKDPVAVDTVCLKMVQERRNAFKGESWPLSPPPISIEEADKKYELGTSDPEKIIVIRLGWGVPKGEEGKPIKLKDLKGFA